MIPCFRFQRNWGIPGHGTLQLRASESMNSISWRSGKGDTPYALGYSIEGSQKRLSAGNHRVTGTSIAASVDIVCQAVLVEAGDSEETGRSMFFKVLLFKLPYLTGPLPLCKL